MMMKKLFFTFVLLIASFCVNAQALKEMIVEPTNEESGAVFIESCDSPDQGILVFKSAISGLIFELNIPTKLINQRYNAARNEYILCVEPTTRQYWIIISGAGYEEVEIEVKAIEASRPSFFRINPKEQIIISNNVQDLILDGDYRLKDNKYDEAENYYRQALAQLPDDVTLLRKLGETCYKQGKTAEATSFLQKVVNLRPSDDESHFWLGNIYYSQGNYEKAALSFITAAELVPENRKYSSEFTKAYDASTQTTAINVCLYILPRQHENLQCNFV